jgi:hypothetical protein
MPKYDETRIKKIRDYVSENKDSETGQTLTIPLRGRNVTMKVYRFPLDLLLFNKNNGRLAAQVEEFEKESGELDPAITKGKKALIKMLLELDPSKTEVLENDLITYKQRDPCIIRSDGVAINGNRRMAILSGLYDKGKGAEFNYLKASVLDESVTDSDLFTLEAKLQFSTDLKMDYSPVNVLLTIEKGLKFNTRETMANDVLMLPGGVKELEGRLDILEMMKAYLVKTRHPGEFYRLQKTYSHFAEVASIIKRLRKKKADGEIEKYLDVAFKMIKCGVGHRDLRDLSVISKTPSAEKSLFKELPGLFDLKKDESDITIKERNSLIDTVKIAKHTAEEIVEGQKAQFFCDKAYGYIDELSTESCDIPFERVVKLLDMLSELIDLKKKQFSKKK